VDHQVLMVVLKTLAKIGPTADPVFRDECEETEIRISISYTTTGHVY